MKRFETYRANKKKNWKQVSNPEKEKKHKFHLDFGLVPHI